MKTILVDLGNTALKWAVLGNEHEPHTVVHRGAPESLHDLYEVWQCEAPDAVLGCTVAAPKLAFSATKFFNACDIPWQWVHSLPTFRCAQWELRNNYLLIQPLQKRFSLCNWEPPRRWMRCFAKVRGIMFF